MSLHHLSIDRSTQNIFAWICHAKETLSALLTHYGGNPLLLGGLLSVEASHVEFWSFLSCYPKQAIQQRVRLPMISDTMTLMWRHCNGVFQSPRWAISESEGDPGGCGETRGRRTRESRSPYGTITLPHRLCGRWGRCPYLTHWGQMTHICVGNIGHHWLR